MRTKISRQKKTDRAIKFLEKNPQFFLITNSQISVNALLRNYPDIAPERFMSVEFFIYCFTGGNSTPHLDMVFRNQYYKPLLHNEDLYGDNTLEEVLNILEEHYPDTYLGHIRINKAKR